MIRVKADRLEEIDGLLYFRNVPFSGIAFYVDGCYVVDKKIYKNGHFVKNYVNEIINKYYGHIDMQEILFDCAEWEPEWSNPPTYFQDKPFTGILYDFRDDIHCTEEMFFLNGSEDPYVEFYWNTYGKLMDISVFIEKEKFSQTLYRYRDGRIQRMGTSFYVGDKRVFFSMHNGEDGKWTSFSISDGYFEHIASMKDRFYFDIVDNKQYFRTLKIKEALVLHEDGIDNELFENLLNNKEIKNLKELWLNDTKVDWNLVEKVLPHIQIIRIRSKIADKSIFKSWKQEFPHVQIILNDEEL